jgi:hypothetical protein
LLQLAGILEAELAFGCWNTCLLVIPANAGIQ